MSDARVPAFEIGLARTRVDVGTGRQIEEDSRFTRTVGSHGVLSEDRVNGTWLAFQRLPQDDRSQVSYGDVHSHNAAALAHFESMGLDAAQVGKVEGALLVEARGAVDEILRAGMPPPSLRGFTSTVRRRVDGIDVVDSFATARMDAQGRPMFELVYWPELSRDVLDEARAERASFETPAGRAMVLRRMPDHARQRLSTGGRVVVIHNRMSAPNDFGPARVAVEVPPGPDTKEVREYFSTVGVALRQDSEAGP